MLHKEHHSNPTLLFFRREILRLYICPMGPQVGNLKCKGNLKVFSCPAIPQSSSPTTVSKTVRFQIACLTILGNLYFILYDLSSLIIWALTVGLKLMLKI